MPHKRNPVLAERVTGLSRLLRADALVGLENMALWHERDISHSSAERFTFERARRRPTRHGPSPISSMASRWTSSGCVKTSSGWVEWCTARACSWRWSRRAPTARRRTGWCRAPHGGLGGEASFLDALRDDPAIGEWLTVDEIERAMDLRHHLAGIEVTYRAPGLEPEA